MTVPSRATPSITHSTTSSAVIAASDLIVDVLLIALVTACVLGFSFHPFFFGDELIAYELASVDDSFFAVFHQLNINKPRLVFNAIEALLAKLEATRLTHAMLVGACMTWINVLIFSVARYKFGASRMLAWLLVLAVLSSRYGVMLYFDYLSGLIETLSSALFLSTALLTWVAFRKDFDRRWASAALVTAIITGLVHERYMVGSLALGGSIAIAECVGVSASRRKHVLGWALALGFVPLIIYWLAIKAVGSLPITTVGGEQRVALGPDTLWTVLTYTYNVILGGNYGLDLYWGQYNHSHPTGRLLGPLAALITILMAGVFFLRKGFAEPEWRLFLICGAVIAAFIAVASLAGTLRQEARFMFPVGILVLITWFLILRNTWRYAAVAVTLVVNMTYLLLSSHDSMVYVYSSRSANSLASSLLTVKNPGRNGIVMGYSANVWVIGGGYTWNAANTRKGMTFSTVNLGASAYVDPFVEGDTLDPDLYDFGLAFNGFGPHQTATYRHVDMETVRGMLGDLDLDRFPVQRVLGNADTWNRWQWSSPPEIVDGALKLTAADDGWLAVPAEELNEHWLVLRARAPDGLQSPLRLQVNWHAKQDNRYLSTSSRIVNPEETWNSYPMMLYAPAGAETGYVYATLHDEPEGAVEVEAVELR